MGQAYKKVGTKYAETISIIHEYDKPEGGRRIFYLDNKGSMHSMDSADIIPNDEIEGYKLLH